jgi:hypothetical protein
MSRPRHIPVFEKISFSRLQRDFFSYCKDIPFSHIPDISVSMFMFFFCQNNMLHSKTNIGGMEASKDQLPL